MSKTDQNTVVSELIAKVQEFLNERDWEKYHNPKDLAEGVCIEASELLQLFQWMSSDEVDTFSNDVTRTKDLEEELADVVIYCLSMANTMNIDITSSVLHKLESNRKKYPAKLYRGKARL